jgi:predicted 3-demethylubiquinone-9 3-methyltransferase (glyoxalase superfamily)
MKFKFQRVQPCLWFDDQAAEAAKFYTSIFPDSRIVATTYYTQESAGPSGKPAGSVLTVVFELDGQPFTALNGGPIFKFNEALSLVINCHDQGEVDHYWERLSEGGDDRAQACGWLKDRFGVSWQVVPTILPELISDPDADKARKAIAAMMRMKKLDIETLRSAAG